MFEIENIKFRRILNSNADWAIEADVLLKDGSFGRGSCPAAIIAGKREKRITDDQSMAQLDIIETELNKKFIHKRENQQSLDTCLRLLSEEIGSNISLAVSLAFARAASCSLKIDFVEYLSRELQHDLNIVIPHLLVPIFSGGVHSKNRDSFQQIMACIKQDGFREEYQISKDLSRITEEELVKRQINFKIAASGGYTIEKLSSIEKLELLREIINIAKYDQSIGVAIDVAAEHLQRGMGYYFEGKMMSSEEFLKLIQNCIEKFHLCYIEDPFIVEHIGCWKRLKKYFGKETLIIGDDLFATQVKNIDSELANGMVIKMNQAGNLTDTIASITEARKNSMVICVSHRSYETEDTAMCDLAIASKSEYIKIGGVRRGERIIKYNQLLRLEEYSK